MKMNWNRCTRAGCNRSTCFQKVGAGSKRVRGRMKMVDQVESSWEQGARRMKIAAEMLACCMLVSICENEGVKRDRHYC